MTRTVYIEDEDVLAIEAGAEAAIRGGDIETWKKLAVLALKWKFNGEEVFACHVDESAGLAEVVELRGYSRKASPPCA